MSENWKKIEGFPNYSVSNLGRIRRDDTGFIRKDGPCRRGYRNLNLFKDGVRLRVMVHRVVAIAFCPKSDGRDYVNHKNGIKADNRAENLEWVTVRENFDHAIATGLTRAGERSPHAVLTEADVIYIRRSGKRLIDLAQEFGVSSSTIYDAKIGRNWSTVKTGLEAGRRTA